jgi:hypothetical protein
MMSLTRKSPRRVCAVVWPLPSSAAMTIADGDPGFYAIAYTSPTSNSRPQPNPGVYEIPGRPKAAIEFGILR